MKLTMLKAIMQSMPRQILLQEKFMVVHGLHFFVYPILSCPLTRDEAYKCLGYLLESVADAMDKLHNKFGVAHLDICLENICFKEESDRNISAMLIDLD